MKIRQHGRGHFQTSQRGLSLVELMVSMTIGLFLMGAVSIIYINTSNSSRASTLESQMNEDAALALELLQQQIRLAGFSNVNASGARRFPSQVVRGCEGDSGATATGSAFADNDAEFSALACNGGGRRPDSFAIRYEATLLNSQTVRDAGGVERPGNCAHEALAPWDATATEGALAGVTSMNLADNRYYIDNDVDGTPSLFCQGRVGPGPAPAGYGAATALIPNVEDMQVQYAVTALPVDGQVIPHQIAGYVDADHLVLGAPAMNWSRVAALRVCLIVRSARPVPAGDNSRADLGTYQPCDPAAGPVTNNDGFLRRAYVTTIQLRNMRPGLPSDYTGGYSWAALYEN
jgi:type IV pilus assembly protein PilW